MRWRPPRLRNRWRFTVWILATVAIITLIAGFAVVRLVEDSFTDRIDDQNAEELSGAITAIDVLGPDLLDRFAELGQVAEAERALLLVDGGVVDVALPSGQTNSPDPLPDLESIPFSQLRATAGQPFEVAAVEGGVRYRAIAGQLQDGRMAVLATSLDSRDTAIKTVIGTMTAAGIAAAVVLAVVVSLVSGYVTRPLDSMIATAEGVGSGALQARVAVGGVEDVSRLGAAINAMLDRLEQAFADTEASEAKLRQFVADASHELRTPLAAILGYAELHQGGMTRSAADVDRAIDRIAAEGARMQALIEELLMLARLDHGRPADLVDVDLVALAESATGDAAAIAPDRPVELVARTRPTTVRGDPVSLRQAIDNLLANTRVHTPEGTAVTVTVDGDDEFATITVADDGPGIDAGDQPHVFDRFFRAERSRARPRHRAATSSTTGTGLGLAIVAAITESHGGTVAVESRPGAGTRFTLSLPRAHDAATPSGVPRSG